MQNTLILQPAPKLYDVEFERKGANYFQVNFPTIFNQCCERIIFSLYNFCLPTNLGCNTPRLVLLVCMPSPVLANKLKNRV